MTYVSVYCYSVYHTLTKIEKLGEFKKLKKASKETRLFDAYSHFSNRLLMRYRQSFFRFLNPLF